MDTVFPAAASALCRGRRARRPAPRARHRTMPVTFAEIKEVDEETEGPEGSTTSGAEERRRRPDLLDERLSRQFAEFRRRRAPREVIREPLDESATGEGAPAPAQRAGSEPLGDARGARAGRPSRPSGKQWTAPNNETT